MPWVVVDVLIGVLALIVLAGICFAGFLHVKRLMGAVKEAGTRVGVVTGEINDLQRQSASHRRS